MCEVCQRYKLNMTEIFLIYPCDMPQISPRFPWNMPEICQIYIKFVSTCMTYNLDLPQIKVRYKYLELIWYLKDTKKIPVFTWKRYLLDTEVGLKRYQYQFGLNLSSPLTCHVYYSSILPFFNASLSIRYKTLTLTFQGFSCNTSCNFLVSLNFIVIFIDFTKIRHFWEKRTPLRYQIFRKVS